MNVRGVEQSRGFGRKGRLVAVVEFTADEVDELAGIAQGSTYELELRAAAIELAEAEREARRR